MKVFRDSPRDIAAVAQILLGGGVVVVPTETVYGLAANALSESACRRIFEIKGRPFIDPLIVHIFSLDQARAFSEFGEDALALAAAFWPGPLTVVVRKRETIPGIVTAQRDTVALRMPSHHLLRRILDRARVPLAAPSANRFGYVSSTRLEHIENALGGVPPAAVDGGPCEYGVESTIIDLSRAKRATILRPGAVSKSMLEGILQREVMLGTATVDIRESGGLPSPGLFDKHYSPRAAIVYPATQEDLAEGGQGKIAAVYFGRSAGQTPPKSIDRFWLSEDRDPAEAARNLYHLLQTLDTEGYQRIYVEQAPMEGIGTALHDRLQRAAGRGGS